MNKVLQRRANNRGFTIVELLIVIVVIGILAAITIVAYTAVSSQARLSSLKSDLSGNGTALAIYNVNNGTFPPDLTTAALKASQGTTYQYTYTSAGNSYCLTGTNNSISYYISNSNTNPTAGACSGDINGGTGLTCPSGFIVVPASTLYGTGEFCVMKYEAKQSSATVPISQVTGTPWTNITQANAITYSANVAGCTGCQLITDTQWLAIAQNIMSVASNWSGGSVGSGYIYSGHNDSAPNNMLAADPSDANGYAGETNVGGNQRRTLTLSNGQVIWDFAGNADEWTSNTTTHQPGYSADAGYSWRNYNNGSLLQNGFPSSDYPIYANSSASAWSSTQGLGQIYSNYNDTTARGFLRGGSFGDAADAGIYSVILNTSAPPVTSIGFRVTK